MDLNLMPKALALIPDGNRRWAKKHSLSVLSGYELGVNKFIEFAEWCNEYGIDSITIWAFSSDNFSRPKHERDALFGIYQRMAKDKKIIAMLHRNRTRLNVIYDGKKVPRALLDSLGKIEEQTRRYKGKVINMLLGYGGREDIIHAAKEAAIRFKNDKTAEFEELFAKSLLSYGVPNLDLIIRTSGEQRLSGFMPWQSNYSELYFSKKLWPDFTKADLKRALADYSRRQRRFGK